MTEVAAVIFDARTPLRVSDQLLPTSDQATDPSQSKIATPTTKLFQTIRRLRGKLALTPEQADHIRFPCC